MRPCPTCSGHGKVPEMKEVESITALAEAVGISKSHASRLFSEHPEIRMKTGCSLKTARKIASHLDITMEEFCTTLFPVS